jgi:hypothetical protein
VSVVGHDEQSPVGQPVDAAWKRRRAQDDLAPAVEIERDHFAPAPVREPQSTSVPPGLFSEDDTGQEGPQLWCIRHVSLSFDQERD